MEQKSHEKKHNGNAKAIINKFAVILFWSVFYQCISNLFQYTGWPKKSKPPPIFQKSH